MIATTINARRNECSLNVLYLVNSFTFSLRAIPSIIEADISTIHSIQQVQGSIVDGSTMDLAKASDIIALAETTEPPRAPNSEWHVLQKPLP